MKPPQKACHTHAHTIALDDRVAAPRMGRLEMTSSAAWYSGIRLEVEESAGLKIVRIRFQMVVGRKGMARQAPRRNTEP